MVAIAAGLFAGAAQAVADTGKIGKVNVTGLGLPSEMGAIESGASQSFTIWTPIDLGYWATMLAHALAAKEATAEPDGHDHVERDPFGGDGRSLRL